MSAKLNAEQTGESVVVAVRLPPNLLAGLDRLVGQMANPPYVKPTRSEIARGLIEERLQSLGVLEAAPTAPSKPVANPTPPKAEAPAAAPPPKPAHKAPVKPVGQLPLPPTLEQAVIAELKAVETPRTGGKLVMDLAAVVRALEAQGYQRAAIHAELERLDRAGVLELMPDSGNPNERKEDRAIVPPRIGDGVPLLDAGWSKRPVDPSPEQDSDALRVRFREALRLKKTSINKSAEPAGCSTTPLRRWLNDGKELDALYRENLDKFLLTVSA